MKKLLIIPFLFLLLLLGVKQVSAATITGTLETTGDLLSGQTSVSVTVTCTGLSSGPHTIVLSGVGNNGSGGGSYSPFVGSADVSFNSNTASANISVDALKGGNLSASVYTDSMHVPICNYGCTYPTPECTTNAITVTDPSVGGQVCSIDLTTDSGNLSNSDAITMKVADLPDSLSGDGKYRVWFYGLGGDKVPGQSEDCFSKNALTSTGVKFGPINAGNYTVKISKSCGFADSGNTFCDKAFSVCTGTCGTPPPDVKCNFCLPNCEWDATDEDHPHCKASAGAPPGTTCTPQVKYCAAPETCDPGHILGCVNPNTGTKTGTDWGNWGTPNPAISLDTLANFFRSPKPGDPPIVKYGTAVGLGINLLFLAAIILALFYLVWGGFDWLTSGGNKQSLTSARQKVIFAIVGLVIVFLAGLLVNLILGFFNIPLIR